MPKKVSFATTNWKDKPSKPANVSQADWDAENSSCFSGFPFPLFFGKKWNQVVVTNTDRKIIPGWYEYNNNTEIFPNVTPPISSSPARVGKFNRPIIYPQYEHMGPFTLEEVTRLWWTTKHIAISQLPAYSFNKTYNETFSVELNRDNITCDDLKDYSTDPPSEMTTQIYPPGSRLDLTANAEFVFESPEITPESQPPVSTFPPSLDEEAKISGGGLAYTGPQNYYASLEGGQEVPVPYIGCGGAPAGSTIATSTIEGHAYIGHSLTFTGTPVVCDIDSPSDYYIRIYHNHDIEVAVGYTFITPIDNAVFIFNGGSVGADAEKATKTISFPAYISDDNTNYLVTNIDQLISRVNTIKNSNSQAINFRSGEGYVYLETSLVKDTIEVRESISTFSYFGGMKTLKSATISYSWSSDLLNGSSGRSITLPAFEYASPNFKVSEYWEYDDGNGNPIYDKATGAILRDPVTGQPV